jgi:hypothetical protein
MSVNTSFKVSGGSTVISGGGLVVQAVGGPAFNPLTAFGTGQCLLWLDANQGLFQDLALSPSATVSSPVTADGQFVGMWKDQSGNANHAITDAYRNGRPTYDTAPTARVNTGSSAYSQYAAKGPGVIFYPGSPAPAPVGNQSYYTSLEIGSLASRAESAKTPISIIAAYENHGSASGSNPHVVDHADQYLGIKNTGYSGAYNGSTTSDVSRPSDSAFVHGVVYDHPAGWTLAEYVNGVAKGTASGGYAFDNTLVDQNNAVRLGRGQYSQQNMAGAIYEVLIYNKALSAQEMLDASNYLKAKWGI